MQDLLMRQLRDSGLKVTKPRIAVLEAIDAHPHADALTICAAVRTSVGHVSTQTIYDVLHALTGANLIRRIEPAGSAARYDSRVGDNHHHLVCRQCQAMVDVDCAVGAAPCLEPSALAGFAVDEAEVTFWGTCPACR